MKKILLIGAGKSATCLIDYLIIQSSLNNWSLTIADANLQLAQSKIGSNPNANAVKLNVTDESERKKLITDADIVISLMPPALHIMVAQDCVALGKNLLTASYIDDAIKKLSADINNKGLFFLCEMGLDPGIDHMSAMQIIHRIKKDGGKIISFKSHTGGLVAPGSDDNPWHYKISWNPRNIVLAGTAGAVYKDDNRVVSIAYHQLFEHCPVISVPGLEPTLAWYPNRDSLSYINTYQLEEATTFIRTTLRYPSFCTGWNVITHLNLTSTSDGKEINHVKTFRDWLDFKLEQIELRKMSLREYLELYADEKYHDQIIKQIEFLEITGKKPLPAFTCSADILQHQLETKLKMQAHDKDMIVMLHELTYKTGHGKHDIKSSLVVKGEDYLRTAMAKTVGLPLGIAAKLILQNKIKLTGLHIPILPEIYEPVLEELALHEIRFSEFEVHT